MFMMKRLISYRWTEEKYEIENFPGDFGKEIIQAMNKFHLRNDEQVLPSTICCR